jgi:O-antigen/teichoic acid export membrane protein
VIQIMANPSFWPAYTIVPWVVAGYFLRYLYFFPVGGLFYSRQTRWVPVATIVAGVLNVGLNIWLIPYFGIQAAAVNTFIGFGVLFVIIFVVGQRRYPIRYEYRRLARVLVIALGLFAAGQLAASLPLWPRTAWEVFLIACFPVLLYLSGFLSAPERRRLALLWRAAKDRSSSGPGNPPIEPDQ